MNEDNLRKLYERLGIAESTAGPPPPPLPTPLAIVEPPPVSGESRGPAALPPAMERHAKPRVTLSYPVMLVSIGAIIAGLYLVSRRGDESPGPSKPPVVKAPSPTVPTVAPPVAPPSLPPDPLTPPEKPPQPRPPEPPAPPPPPELTPAERRAALVRKNGGTDESEAAVARALDWLARHQASTGEWEAGHFDRLCPRTGSCLVKEAAGDPAYTPGVTGLALLAFMEAGHGPASGPHAKAISLGLAWLVEHQNAQGGIVNGPLILFYNQAVATRALCEAAALTGDDRFRSAAQKALDCLGKSQLADGGWNYYHDPADLPRNDASIAGWVAFAIRSAERAKLAVPSDMKGRVRDLFVRRTVAETGEVIYSDREPGAGRRGVGLVALGLFIRGPSGGDDPEIGRRALARVMAARPEWDLFVAAQEKAAQFPFSPDQNMAAWYYGTEAMFRQGGSAWKSWNDAVRDLLVEHQVREGHAGGSWEPETSYIGREGGRVFSTAIAVMMLSIYARER